MKISIITATYNCVKVITDCLASVVAQSYPNIEHIVIDGGSTDGTLDILKDHRDQLDVLISEPDDGIYSALNKGLSYATGDIVGFLHADDVFAHSNVVYSIAKAFSSNSAAIAAYGDLQYVRQDNLNIVVRNWRSEQFTPRLLRYGWMPPHPTMYVRRDWYKKIRGFDTNYKISADYLSILKLFQDSQFKSVYVPGVFVKMRMGGASNRSIWALVQKSREDWRALRQSNFSMVDSVVALSLKNLTKLLQFFLPD